MAFAAIASRVGAVRLALANGDGTLRFQSLSKVQGLALLEIIKDHRAQLSPLEKADLATLISGVNWCGDDGDALLACLAGGEVFTRAKQQEYMMWPHFVTQALWDFLLDPNISADAKLTAITQHLERLGLRHLKEATSKLTTSIWLLLWHTAPEKLNYVQKQGWLSHVKKEMVRILSFAAHAKPYLPSLPATPAELFRLHPKVYRTAFSGEEGHAPVACPLDMSRVRALDSSYRCRGAGTDAGLCAAASRLEPGGVVGGQNLALMRAGSDHGCLDSKLDHFESLVTHQLRQISEWQSHATRALTHGHLGHGGPPPQRSGSSLEGLVIHGTSGNPPPGLPSIADGKPASPPALPVPPPSSSAIGDAAMVTPPRGPRLREHVGAVMETLAKQQREGKLGSEPKQHKRKVEEEQEEEDSDEEGGESQEDEEEKDHDLTKKRKVMKAKTAMKAKKTATKAKQSESAKAPKRLAAPDWSEFLIWPKGGPTSFGAFTTRAYKNAESMAKKIGHDPKSAKAFGKEAYGEAAAIFAKKTRSKK